MNKKKAFWIAFAITYIGISVGTFVKEGPPPEEAVFPLFFIGIPILSAIGGGIGILIFPITQRIRENRARKGEHVEQITPEAAVQERPEPRPRAMTKPQSAISSFETSISVREKALSPREQLEKEKEEIVRMIDEALEEEERKR